MQKSESAKVERQVAMDHVTENILHMFIWEAKQNEVIYLHTRRNLIKWV